MLKLAEIARRTVRTIQSLPAIPVANLHFQSSNNSAWNQKNLNRILDIIMKGIGLSGILWCSHWINDFPLQK
ncbi:unnamed protein product [Blepharisma stoltei]|uniref:Uncharacterized protein n=1 Tax=Blepharisma stoltei TaxID=1481888 RepID=A0AAU9J8W0_9CILI|nr:unnamed protein product [Blepharisma stoltei]